MKEGALQQENGRLKALQQERGRECCNKSRKYGGRGVATEHKRPKEGMLQQERGGGVATRT